LGNRWSAFHLFESLRSIHPVREDPQSPHSGEPRGCGRARRGRRRSSLRTSHDGRNITASLDHDGHDIAASVGDPDRFRPVFDRHFPAVRAYLTGRTGPDSGEDLAIETFAVAFRARARFDADQPTARPWLFGIATNVLRHHRRSEFRRLRAHIRLRANPLASADPAFEEVEDQLDARSAVPLLARGLARLPGDQREALLLHVWAGLDYEGVADALKIPIGTVRSRISRARHRLRELLRASGHGQGVDDGEGITDE
jgi:RNA polymerase sigma-70 factor (ECF subfamily)